MPGVCADDDDTAAEASIGDVSGCADSIDAQVRAILVRVLAQRRSAEAAFGYVEAFAPGVKANCWLVLALAHTSASARSCGEREAKFDCWAHSARSGRA